MMLIKDLPYGIKQLAIKELEKQDYAYSASDSTIFDFDCDNTNQGYDFWESIHKKDYTVYSDYCDFKVGDTVSNYKGNKAIIMRLNETKACLESLDGNKINRTVSLPFIVKEEKVIEKPSTSTFIFPEEGSMDVNSFKDLWNARCRNQDFRRLFTDKREIYGHYFFYFEKGENYNISNIKTIKRLICWNNSSMWDANSSSKPEYWVNSNWEACLVEEDEATCDEELQPIADEPEEEPLFEELNYYYAFTTKKGNIFVTLIVQNTEVIENEYMLCLNDNTLVTIGRIYTKDIKKNSVQMLSLSDSRVIDLVCKITKHEACIDEHLRISKEVTLDGQNNLKKIQNAIKDVTLEREQLNNYDLLPDRFESKKESKFKIKRINKLNF